MLQIQHKETNSLNEKINKSLESYYLGKLNIVLGPGCLWQPMFA